MYEYTSPLSYSNWQLLKEHYIPSRDVGSIRYLIFLMYGLMLVLITLNIMYAIKSHNPFIMLISGAGLLGIVYQAMKTLENRKDGLYKESIQEIMDYMRSHDRTALVQSFELLKRHESPITRAFIINICPMYVNALINGDTEETLKLAEHYLESEIRFYTTGNKSSYKHAFEALIEVQNSRE